LGIYTVAVGFAELILNIPQILSRVVLSFASEAKDKQGWLLAAHGARLGLLVMGCLVIPMAIFMEPLIHVLYSARFGAAMLPCLVLLPGVVALGFAIILANGLMGYGKVIEWTKAVTFGCAATILLDLLLIPHFGVLGASIASTLAYGTVAWYSLQAFVMSSGLSPRELMLPSKGDLSTYARDLARYWSKLSYRQPK